jgi:hypothetical protein
MYRSWEARHRKPSAGFGRKEQKALLLLSRPSQVWSEQSLVLHCCSTIPGFLTLDISYPPESLPGFLSQEDCHRVGGERRCWALCQLVPSDMLASSAHWHCPQFTFQFQLSTNTAQVPIQLDLPGWVQRGEGNKCKKKPLDLAIFHCRPHPTMLAAEPCSGVSSSPSLPALLRHLHPVESGEGVNIPSDCCLFNSSFQIWKKY